MARRFTAAIAAALLFATAGALGGCSARTPVRDTIPIRFGEHVLHAEVADGEPAREQGLMFRRDLPKDGGMLFVFDEPHRSSFWMKNTPLPLSIAFLDADRRILNVEQMAPFDDRTFHRSAGLALYAVEAHRGWFEARGIGAGVRAEFEWPPARR